MKLDAGLKDPHRPVEEQEKTIEWVLILQRNVGLNLGRILIELDQSDEPAWAYLEYQHAHILDSMRAIYKKADERVKSKIPLVTGC